MLDLPPHYHCGDRDFSRPLLFPLTDVLLSSNHSFCSVSGLGVSLSFRSCCSFLKAHAVGPVIQTVRRLAGSVQQRPHCSVQSPCTRLPRGTAPYLVSPSDRDCEGRGFEASQKWPESTAYVPPEDYCCPLGVQPECFYGYSHIPFSTHPLSAACPSNTFMVCVQIQYVTGSRGKRAVT